jgi:hypothetical protein
MSQENVLSFNNALEELNKISEIFKFNVWVPSLQKEIEFKPINGKQQKELLGAAMDTSLYNVSFSKAFYNIIKDNIVTDDKSIIDNFNLVDKTSIAIHLKNKISNKVSVMIDDVKEEFEIQPLIDGIKTYKCPESKSFSSENAGFTLNVEIAIPTIKTEYEYDLSFKDNKKPEDIKTSQELQTVIQNAFIGETSKYITKVKINSNDVVFKDLNFEDRIRLIEKLPSVLIKQIVEQIAEWKTDLEKVITVTSTAGKSQAVNIDSVLFLS